MVALRMGGRSQVRGDDSAGLPQTFGAHGMPKSSPIEMIFVPTEAIMRALNLLA